VLPQFGKRSGFSPFERVPFPKDTHLFGLKSTPGDFVPHTKFAPSVRHFGVPKKCGEHVFKNVLIPPKVPTKNFLRALCFPLHYVVSVKHLLKRLHSPLCNVTFHPPKRFVKLFFLKRGGIYTTQVFKNVKSLCEFALPCVSISPTSQFGFKCAQLFSV